MAKAFLSQNWHRVASLQPILKSHIRVHAHRYGNECWYVLQDLASGKVHRFTRATYYVIGQMDGHRTVDQIWLHAAERLDEHAPSQDEMIKLLGDLHNADVLNLSDVPDTEELVERATKQRRKRRERTYKNPVAITVPLWDPNAFLGRLAHWLPALSSRTVFLGWLAVVGIGLGLAALHFDRLSASFSSDLIVGEGLLLMLLVYPVVKFLHELGHGLAVKVRGGEVHEMGIIFLVFIPVPYVDASAATAFRSKFDRALVGGAGMMAELFVASFALFLWLVIEPGVLRAALYDVMVIASISSVIINGNPLMRFDAYYILADLIEVPNLATRSNKFWRYLVVRYMFGKRDELPPAGATAREKRWLFAFAPLSYIYRFVVVFGIALFVASEYFFVGVVIGLWAVTTAFVIPAAKALYKVVDGADFGHQHRRARWVTFGGVAAIVAVLAGVPVPQHTNAEGVIWIPDTAIVRANTAGQITKPNVDMGERVGKGAEILQLVAPDTHSASVVFDHRLAAYAGELMAVQFEEPARANLLRRRWQAEKAGAVEAQQRVVKLSHHAAVEGVVMWADKARAAGRFVREGDVLGHIIPQQTQTIRAVIRHEDISLVRESLAGVEVVLPALGWTPFTAKIARSVPAASGHLPSPAFAQVNGGSIPVDPSSQESLAPFFVVDLEVDKPLPAGRFGARALIRFEHFWEPVGVQVFRNVRQLLISTFEL